MSAPPLRFRVLDTLGEGAMGIVYAAHDEIRDMRVAVKVLRRIDALSLYRFKREFRAVSDLSHPNIVNLYELICENDRWSLSMELVEGVDFLSYVRGTESDLGAMSLSQSQAELSISAMVTRTAHGRAPSEADPEISGASCLPDVPDVRPIIDDTVDLSRLRDSLFQLASALSALHSIGVVHRDLKPTNIRVTGKGRVVLMDFGVVAEIDEPDDPQLTSVIVGTPAFMAPEQCLRIQPSAASDWYAFGVMLYLALTRHIPFSGDTDELVAAKQICDPLPVSDLVDGAPDDLSRLCMHLLARDPGQRAGASDVLDALGVTRRQPGRASHPMLVTPKRPGSARELDEFVGRWAELHQLRDVYDRVSAGETLCVVVEGGSGIGKTTLIERFAREVRASRADVVVLNGRCNQRESLAYKAFDGVVDDLGHFLLHRDGAARAALLPQDAPAITCLFPSLSRVPECRKGKKYQGRDPLDLREQAVRALRALLGAMARDNPVVLCIEDVQWADHDSLELLEDLLRPPVPAGLLILACLRTSGGSARRPGELDLLSRLGDRLIRVPIGPLSDGEQRELMTKLARRHGLGSSLDPAPLRDLLRDLGGYPLLLAELVQYFQQSPDGGTGAASEVGFRVNQAIWQRISGLSRPPTDLLATIAIAGEPLPLRVLAQASGLSDNVRERAWAVLRNARLARQVVRADGALWLLPYHDKVREAVVEHLSDEQRAGHHHELALAMQGWGSASPGALAHHFWAAGDRVLALRYQLIAARDAAEQLALVRAAELYRDVLERIAGLPDEPDIGLDSELPLLRCRAWIGLVDGMRITEQTTEAFELLDRAEAVARAGDLASELATIHFLRGNLLFPTGDTDGCLREHREARVFAKQAGSLEYEIRALGGIGDAHFASGYFVSACENFDVCVELCREFEFTGMQTAYLPLRGWSRLYLNQLDEAEADCREGLEAAGRIGHRRAEALSRGCLAIALTEMGRYTEAEREFAASVAISRQLGMQRFELIYTALMGRAIALQARRGGERPGGGSQVADRRDEAEAMIQDGIARSRDSDRLFSGPVQYGALAFVTRDPATLDLAITRGEQLLRAGSLAYTGFSFYRDVLDALFRFGDHERLVTYSEHFEAFASREPQAWSEFFLLWARCLAEHSRAPGTSSSRPTLEALRAKARTIGLHSAADVVERALG